MRTIKIIIFIFFFLFFSLPREVFASSAKSVVETQVEGDQVEVYQSVETTVNGQTVRKESSQPGKLELEMKKVGENEPTVIFSETTISPGPTSILNFPEKKPLFSLANQIIEFVRKFLTSLTDWFK